MVKFALKGQSSGPVQYSSPVVQSSEWIHVHPSIIACIEEGSIRLVGGTTAEEGRVHICYNGVWSTVCQDTFDVADATVVCRQLGHNTVGESLWRGGKPLKYHQKIDVLLVLHPGFDLPSCFFLLCLFIGTEVIRNMQFPEGTGEVWLDNIGCAGMEKIFMDCPFDTIVGSNSCGHSEDASMRCQPSG